MGIVLISSWLAGYVYGYVRAWRRAQFHASVERDMAQGKR